MTNQSTKTARGINWTQALKDAGIAEPPWDNASKQIDSPATTQAIKLDDKDKENWMHV
jgi:hypothetical protein